MRPTATGPYRAAFRCSDCEVGYHPDTLRGVEPRLVNPSAPVKTTLGAVPDAGAQRFGSDS